MILTGSRTKYRRRERDQSSTVRVSTPRRTGYIDSPLTELPNDWLPAVEVKWTSNFRNVLKNNKQQQLCMSLLVDRVEGSLRDVSQNLVEDQVLVTMGS